jgi:hypothetical protein
MGNKFAIVIAVETYQDLRIPRVAYAEDDAKEFYKALRLHGFLDGNIDLLLSSLVLSISEMGHFLNRILWPNQSALTSFLKSLL